MSQLTKEGLYEYLIANSYSTNTHIEYIIKTYSHMKGMWEDIPVGRFVIKAPNVERAIILLEEYLNTRHEKSIIKHMMDINQECGEEEDTYYDVINEFEENDTLWIEEKDSTKIRNKIVIK